MTVISDLVHAAWFVEIVSHDGRHGTKAFATKQEAETWIALIPVMQAKHGGEWLQVHRAILRPSHLTLN
jgi:hypothetical protein